MEIGSQVFYLKTKEKQIKEGMLIGQNISDTGYLLATIQDKESGQITSVEMAHVKTSMLDAEKHVDKVKPIMEEGDKIIKEATDKVDKLRIEVIGEPTFKQLADTITGKGKPNA